MTDLERRVLELASQLESEAVMAELVEGRDRRLTLTGAYWHGRAIALRHTAAALRELGELGGPPRWPPDMTGGAKHG